MGTNYLGHFGVNPSIQNHTTLYEFHSTTHTHTGDAHANQVSRKSSIADRTLSENNTVYNLKQRPNQKTFQKASAAKQVSKSIRPRFEYLYTYT